MQNRCNWLLKSPNTESFDIVELAEETEWFMWKGLVESDYSVSIECVECSEAADCNYRGKCDKNDRCECDDGYFGPFCQFLQPCDVIRSECDTNHFTHSFVL